MSQCQPAVKYHHRVNKKYNLERIPTHSPQPQAGRLCVMRHRIPIPLATPHIVLKRLCNLQHALDVLHAKRGFLRERDALGRFDRVLDL